MTHLDTEIQLLKASVIEMWQLVIFQLDKSEQALSLFDKGLIQDIKVNEKLVDTFELKIDRDCENILALFNPVAVDLRFVLAVLKINYNLERIGDYANGIGKMIDDLESPVNNELFKTTRVFEMYEQIRQLMRESMEAFEKENNEQTRSIFGRDKEINKINKAATKIISEYIIRKPDEVFTAMNLLSVIRKLERAGDHIQNIAEEIIFYMEAKVMKHNKARKKQIKLQNQNKHLRESS
jgi:phosphate transport system protein